MMRFRTLARPAHQDIADFAVLQTILFTLDAQRKKIEILERHILSFYRTVRIHGISPLAYLTILPETA